MSSKGKFQQNILERDQTLDKLENEHMEMKIKLTTCKRLIADNQLEREFETIINMKNNIWEDLGKETQERFENVEESIREYRKKIARLQCINLELDELVEELSTFKTNESLIPVLTDMANYKDHLKSSYSVRMKRLVYEEVDKIIIALLETISFIKKLTVTTFQLSNEGGKIIICSGYGTIKGFINGAIFGSYDGALIGYNISKLIIKILPTLSLLRLLSKFLIKYLRKLDWLDKSSGWLQWIFGIAVTTQTVVTVTCVGSVITAIVGGVTGGYNGFIKGLTQFNYNNILSLFTSDLQSNSTRTFRTDVCKYDKLYLEKEENLKIELNIYESKLNNFIDNHVNPTLEAAIEHSKFSSRMSDVFEKVEETVLLLNKHCAGKGKEGISHWIRTKYMCDMLEEKYGISLKNYENLVMEHLKKNKR